MTIGVVNKRITNNNITRGGEITIFIEELFYDNISIQGISLKGNAEYRKQLKVLCECEAYLNENLKGKYLKAFQKFGESWNFINDETNKMYFKTGFSLGGQCIREVFEDKNLTE